ncbi:MAG: fumarylacetoacetate hydrolase family protein [Acidimicrobiia bacterium]|nr:MAG: fumarylacetoacetate hydrolase family protein [Acidimicrobiia bacterium]
MKLASFTSPTGNGVAVDVDGVLYFTGYKNLLEFIGDGAEAHTAAESAVESRRVVSDTHVGAPLYNPSKMLFCGLNFKTHINELPGAETPEEPFFFSKLPSSIIGPGEPIILPFETSQVDWEVEVAAILGTRARNVTETEAEECIFGYTVVNDISSREIQFKDSQITLGKGLDGHCPMGPVVVTRDEIPDSNHLIARCWVNGELVQEANTDDLLFSFPFLISWLSRAITLEPGDIITTGTPAGVGTFMDPPRYLADGDEVTVSVDAIGDLTNPVVAGWA